MPATLSAAGVRCHISLNVADLARSVDFYRVLFATEPAKQRPDYAKFDLADPPLVLSLEPSRHAPGGALNHLGFRLPDAEALLALQGRLEAAGIRSQREEGVECCYARQTKFWVTDPDRNLWEFYVLEEDLEHRGLGQSREAMLPAEAELPAVAWEHRLDQPVPDVIALADGAAGEVFLRGTFNAVLPEATRRRLLQEAYRVLRPGGRIVLHQLVADGSLAGGLRPLPGPAQFVQQVPEAGEPLRALEEAGFVGLTFEKLSGAACFTQNGVGMRECLLAARKPAAGGQGGTRLVVYRGPFREVTDDAGRVYRRGERVAVPAAICEQLRQGPYAEQFTCLARGESSQ